MPSGNLVCARNGKHYKWYQSTGHINTYIPKKDRLYAEQLAIKKYLCLLLTDLLHEKRAIEFYLNHHSISRFYNSSSPNRRHILLGTLWLNGKSHVFSKCLFQIAAIYISRYHSNYPLNYNIWNKGTPNKCWCYHESYWTLFFVIQFILFNGNGHIEN